MWITSRQNWPFVPFNTNVLALPGIPSLKVDQQRLIESGFNQSNKANDNHSVKLFGKHSVFVSNGMPERGVQDN